MCIAIGVVTTHQSGRHDLFRGVTQQFRVHRTGRVAIERADNAIVHGRRLDQKLIECHALIEVTIASRDSRGCQSHLDSFDQTGLIRIQHAKDAQILIGQGIVLSIRHQLARLAIDGHFDLAVGVRFSRAKRTQEFVVRKITSTDKQGVFSCFGAAEFSVLVGIQRGDQRLSNSLAAFASTFCHRR